MASASHPGGRMGDALLALAIIAAMSSPLAAETWWKREITRYRLAPLLAELTEKRARGDWQSALATAGRILAIAPARDDVRLDQLHILYEHQRYPAALQAAALIGPDSLAYPNARFITGLTYFESGQTGQAKTTLDQAAMDTRLDPADRQLARTLVQRIALSKTYVSIPRPKRAEYEVEQPSPPPPPPPPRTIAAPTPDLPPAPSPPPPPMETAYRALDEGQAGAALEALDRAQAAGAGPIVDLYRGYALLNLEKPTAAEAAFINAATAIDLSADIRATAWAQAGYLALARDDTPAAIEAFQQSVRLAPPSRALLLQLGYAHAAALHWQEAVITLEKADAMEGGAPPLAQDIAYAARNAGAPDVAAQWFRRALDSGDTLSRERQLALKQEVEWLEDRFDMSLYSAFRGNAVDGRTLNPLERSVLQSQGGLSFQYIPGGMGREIGRFAAITGRLLWSYDKDRLSIPSASWQGGVGVSVRPLPSDNLVIGAERLVAIGRNARNDWLLRTGYSWSHFEPGGPWPDATLYLDAALIDPSSPDILSSGNIEVGKRVAPQPWLRLWPHLVFAGNWQDDDYGSVSLLEAGPGISATLNFDEGRYRAYRASLTLSLEYRVKLAGSSIGRSGPLLTVSLAR